MNHEPARTRRPVLRAIGQALSAYGERVAGCFPGRLNGADFALCLPVGGVAHETAQALASALRAVLPGMGPQVAIALGAVELQHATTLAQALAVADQALARAESRGPYAVALGRFEPAPHRYSGEDTWRRATAMRSPAGARSWRSFRSSMPWALVHLNARCASTAGRR
jgi:hypothetical protein